MPIIRSYPGLWAIPLFRRYCEIRQEWSTTNHCLLGFALHLYKSDPRTVYQAILGIILPKMQTIYLFILSIAAFTLSDALALDHFATIKAHGSPTDILGDLAKLVKNTVPKNNDAAALEKLNTMAQDKLARIEQQETKYAGMV